MLRSRRTMRRAFVIASMAMATVGSAGACECAYAPPCSRIHGTTAIFIGQVIAAGKDGAGPFRFRVEEAFKGIPKETAEVDIQAGPCIAGYRVGRRYLVLANPSQGQLESGDCSGTLPIEHADEDVRLLRAWTRGAPVQQLQGSIAANTDDSSVRYSLAYGGRSGLAGVRLTASKGDKTYTATTDGRGAFRLEVPEPGRYEVRAALPGYASSKPVYRFDVEAGSCSEHDIGMWTDSSVSGIVVDRRGSPVAGIPVELMQFDREVSYSPQTAVSDAKGAFRFTRIPVGAYLLGVNLNGLSSKVPYEPRFYPGATRRQDATAVRVSGPQTVTGLVLPIGDRLPTRRIRVALVWPDGRPVTNGSVMCQSPKSTDGRVISDWVSPDTDQNGEAICEVLTDRDYLVNAARLAWSSSSRPVQPVETRPRIFVGAGAGPADVRIVVDQANDISNQERPLERLQHREIFR